MRKRLLPTILLGFILLKALNALQAQESSLALTMGQAQKYAIEHNKTMQNASLDIKKAQANKWYSISNMLPQVSGTLDYTSMLGYEMTMRMEFDNPFTGEQVLIESQVPMKPTSNLTLQASITVSGAQIVGATLGKLAKEMAQMNFQKTEQTIKSQVRTIYFSILALENTVELLDKSMESMLKLEKMAQNAVDVGVKEQTDADQLTVQISSMQNRINSTKRNLDILYNSLRLLLGTTADAEIKLTETIENIINIEYSNRLLGETFLLSNNLDYQLIEKNAELSKKQLRINEWAYGPSLTAFYRYTRKIQTTNFDMSAPNIVGLTLNVPIFSSGSRLSKVFEAKCNYKIALNNKEMFSDQLIISERQLKYALVNNMENYETQQKNIEVSQRIFNSINNKFEHGYASSMEVTTSSMNLITAQSNYIQSMMELINAQIELEKLFNK